MFGPIQRAVSDTELATRLSYFFWSTLPDAELLDLAAGGRLHVPSVLHEQVERMLNDPRSARFTSDFTGQWLRLRQILDTTPDEKLYGKFDELLRISMMRESEGFFRQMIVEDLPIDNFLDANWTMLNQRLAEHYGVPGVSGVETRKVLLPPGCVRGGLLTQAAILKVTANGTTTSPVQRGVWVLENILGSATPPPPPNVGGIEPDIRGATTVREQLEKHRKVPSCSVCHSRIDPPGFALESFDPIGEYREHYLGWKATDAEKGWGNVVQGAKVDCSGMLPTGETFSDVERVKAAPSATPRRLFAMPCRQAPDLWAWARDGLQRPGCRGRHHQADRGPWQRTTNADSRDRRERHVRDTINPGKAP